MKNAHTPGPVEILARLSIQSDRYVTDEEFRHAVDAVISKPVFDAAPELLAELKKCVLVLNAAADKTQNALVSNGLYAQAEITSEAIAKATGGKT